MFPASSLHPTTLPPRSRPLAAVTLAACLLLTACRGPDYLPLASGAWRYYASHATVLDEPREARVMITNLGTHDAGDGTLHVRRLQSRTFEYLRRTAAGIERVAHRGPRDAGLVRERPPRLLLPRDPAPGMHWTVEDVLGLAESRTFARADRIIARRVPVTLGMTVSALDAVVDVPAGRFADCVLIRGEGSATVRTDRGNGTAEIVVRLREWYAPGIGLVRLERSESSTSTFVKDGHLVRELLDHDG